MTKKKEKSLANKFHFSFYDEECLEEQQKILHFSFYVKSLTNLMKTKQGAPLEMLFTM